MSEVLDEISRVTPSKTAAQAAYDRMSRWYDWLAAGAERRLTSLGLHKLDVQKGEKVLEIGCGTGHALVELAKAAGEPGLVCGIDISQGMINVAGDRLKAIGLADRVELTCGDATQLTYEEDFFDAIFMGFVLELFDTPEIPPLLAECRRALRQGGRLCVVALARRDRSAVRLYEWFHRRLPSYVDCRPIYARQSIQSAGFDLLDSTEGKMWGLPVEIVLAIVPQKRNGIR
ncbi:MAG: methyltransferase domain-containing protein [Chloroflexi bacterium]|nr:methyltransferase domain-containing protein [Chloroflexota bacterium]